MKDNFTIQNVSWQTHQSHLIQVRTQVFIQEQQVPIALEWDGLDERAQHLLAFDSDGLAIGCARLLGEGCIGRMAVIKAWRGLAVGTALLNEALSVYRQEGVQTITLSAQIHAKTFYEKSGFTVCSAPYLDANILHVDMQLCMNEQI